jgi:hypothetical protein
MRPSRETRIVRVIDPRLSWRVALERPRVIPSGAKIKRRVGPTSVTRFVTGPDALHSAAPPLRGAMLSVAESTESVSS